MIGFEISLNILAFTQTLPVPFPRLVWWCMILLYSKYPFLSSILHPLSLGVLCLFLLLWFVFLCRNFV